MSGWKDTEAATGISRRADGLTCFIYFVRKGVYRVALVRAEVGGVLACLDCPTEEAAKLAGDNLLGIGK